MKSVVARLIGTVGVDAFVFRYRGQICGAVHRARCAPCSRAHAGVDSWIFQALERDGEQGTVLCCDPVAICGGCSCRPTAAVHLLCCQMSSKVLSVLEAMSPELFEATARTVVAALSDSDAAPGTS